MKIWSQHVSTHFLILSSLVAGMFLIATQVSADDACNSPVAKTDTPTSGINMDQIIQRTCDLIKIKTYRGDDNPDVIENLEIIRRDYFQPWVDAFNDGSVHKLESFDWQSEDEKYRVFGWKAGIGDRKISIISHLDTVGPGNNDWQPFNPRVEVRLYNNAPVEFLVGRGSIDDKGPAVTAFEVLTQTLTSLQAQSLDNVTLELLLDTSEETDMSTPQYYEAHPEEKPELGVVFDAFWCIRAEKGIDRPKFTVAADAVSTPLADSLHITQLVSAEGPVNMIPTSAEATIIGNSNALNIFADNVEAWYQAYRFDDINYRPAELEVTHNADSVVLKTLVASAQHGSAPTENRVNGANPVVALTNFLAGLVDNGTLANNPAGELSRFVRWAFGTYTMGETHPDLLERFDTIFNKGNGTTYGLTTLKTEEDSSASLEIDIRYAIGHHSKGWDGSEGKLEGDSLFKSVFEQLVTNYRNDAGGAEVMVSFTPLENGGAIGPDISNPRSTNLFKINTAYRAAMGTNCPMFAIGGGTDAKGHPELVAAGPLFTENMGPPVNFHGLDEGAPLIDLESSARILMHLFKQEASTLERQFEHRQHTDYSHYK